MFRWVRRAVLVIALVVLVGSALLALTARPDLNRTRSDVRARWAPLRTELESRYQLLANANNATRAAGGPERAIVSDIDAALADWRASKTASVTTQVHAANVLEALGRRLTTAVTGSARLRAMNAVIAAARAYANAAEPPSAAAFDTAVRKYENARGGSFRRPVVGLFGYDSIPSYDTGIA
jgi:hypothetical protein